VLAVDIALSKRRSGSVGEKEAQSMLSMALAREALLKGFGDRFIDCRR